jgi:hypothetical protein
VEGLRRVLDGEVALHFHRVIRTPDGAGRGTSV